MPYPAFLAVLPRRGGVPEIGPRGRLAVAPGFREDCGMDGPTAPTSSTLALVAAESGRGSVAGEAWVAAAAAHGGAVEHAEADRAVLSFPGVRQALHCAVELQRSAGPGAIAIAVHIGEVARSGDELRGRALVKCARIAGAAHAGEILASDLVASIVNEDGGTDYWFDDAGETELRGLKGRHRLLRLRWSDARPAPLRVVIAEDATLLRDGVAALLREHGFDVVAAVGDAIGLMDAVARHRPDMALVDIRMPPTFTNEGLIAAERIRQEHPQVGVLVLSQHVEPSYATRLVRSGAARSGYLLKDRLGDVEVLLDAIARIAGGGCVVDSGLAARLMESAGARGSLAELTEREREVLSLVAEGLSNRAIAERLVVTGRTVETHIGQIFSKLGLREDDAEHRRVAAVLAYLRASAD